MITKGELVRVALRQLGITSDAALTGVDPDSVQDCLSALEDLMYEWKGPTPNIGYDIGYNFYNTDGDGGGVDDLPLPADDSWLMPWAKSAVASNLALRIAGDFGVTPDTNVVAAAQLGWDIIVTFCTRVPSLKRAEQPIPAAVPRMLR